MTENEPTSISTMATTENAERDATIVEWYKAGLTLEALGEEFGLSAERVRQVINRAVGSCTKAVLGESRAARKAARVSQGWLGRRELEQLQTGYRQALRLFHEEHVVRLYKAGMSMGDVSRLVRRRYDPLWVQDILKDAGIGRRPCGQYERTLSPVEYPWEVWTKGGWHEVMQGREFDAKPECFRSVLYAKAKRDGRKVAAHIDGKVVRFCFFTPSLQERPQLQLHD